MSNAKRGDSQLLRFQFSRTTHGGPPLMDWIPVAASQTIRVGDPVTVANSAISRADAASGTLYGIAAGNVTTTAANELTKCPVWLADRTNLFVGKTDAAINATHVPLSCDIKVSGADFLIDVGETAKEVVVAVEKLLEDDQTDTTDLPRVEFYIQRSSYDLIKAAK